MVIKDNQIGFGGAAREGWAHLGIEEYWPLLDHPSAVFSNPTPYLKSVCWCRPEIKIRNITKFGKFKLYIR